MAQVAAWRDVGRSDEWIATRLGRTRGAVKNFLQYGSSRACAKPEKTTRVCLHCRRGFLSWGPGNRLCGACKDGFAKLAPTASPIGDGCHLVVRGTR